MVMAMVMMMAMAMMVMDTSVIANAKGFNIIVILVCDHIRISLGMAKSRRHIVNPNERDLAQHVHLPIWSRFTALTIQHM